MNEGDAISSVSGVIAPSLYVLESVKEFYNIKLPNAKVIYNPVTKISDKDKISLDVYKKYKF